MFGFIKNLITGIMNFITGLLPGKKKSNDYYLELKEETETKSPVAAAKVAADKVASAAKSAAEKVADITESDASKAVAATNGNQKSAEPVAAVPVSETSNGAIKKPSRKTSIKAAKAAKETKTEPAKVELVQTAEGVTVEPKINATPALTAKPKAGETTFAPDYLMPTSTNGRRRPGANMNPFLEMARQVKTPSNKQKP